MNPVRALALAALLSLSLAACSQAPAARPIPPTGQADRPAAGGSVRHFDLTAEVSTVELKPGLHVRAWTYNGGVPGPTLRATVGDLVVVTLHNRLPQGTTIHWHGLAVPNGEDGVAGVTQDPVPPGQSATYSFVAPAAGTYWYHSHQNGAEQVDRGLYGVLVIEPRENPAPVATDAALVFDEWPLGLETAKAPPPGDFSLISYITFSVNGKTGPAVAPVRFTAGRPVRLRLVNVGNFDHFVHLDGAPVTIVAFDGHAVAGGPPTVDALPLGPAERIDVVFQAPDHPLWLHLQDAMPPASDVLVPLVPTGEAIPAPPAGLAASGSPILDIFRYPASALDSPWPAGGTPQRTFTLHLSVVSAGGRATPSLDGLLYEINGKTFPNTEPLLVSEGDLVQIQLVNDSKLDHPIHLHGHFFQVLSVDGRPPDGIIVKDTVVVGPRQTVVIGFRADNPGWWMIHCHELYHARGGMMAMLGYEGVPRLAQLGGPFAARPD